MAIGGISSPSWYKVGGKALGVQLGGKSATELFGGASASSLFAASITATSGLTVDATQIALKGMQDQIDRIQGFRTNLSVAEKQKLADYQKTIQDINSLASARALTKDEISERADAYVESYAILGKEYVDFSNDETVTDLSTQLKELIATKPIGAEAVRLERLQNTLTNLQDQINASETGGTELLTQRAISVNKQIQKLTAPRPMSSLSVEEINKHDELVEQINEYVGFELELTSTKKKQIERLQLSMDLIEKGAALNGSGLFI